MSKSHGGLRRMFQGTRPQLIAALTGSISAINDGMHYGWSAPVIPVLHRDDTPIPISKTDDNWLESVYLLGGIAGLPITIYLVDRIGRRNSTIVSSLTSLVSWLMIAFAGSVTWLYIARFLSGVAGDMAFVATPMYVSEIADQKIRGLLSSIIYLMMLFGILLIYIIAPFTPFYIPSVVGSLLLLFQLCSFSFMPKSPYYLLSKGKVEQARKSLTRLRTHDNVEEELEDMKKAIERQQKERGRPQDLILVKSNRKALIIMTMLNGGQPFAAICVMLMNMHTILTAADSVYFTANTAAIIFSSCMFVSATVSSFFVDKYGRKILLFSSGILTSIALLTLAIYFNVKSAGYAVQSVSWIPVVAVMGYAVVFKVGLGMVPIVVSSEIFSNRVKAMGMTIADAIYILSGLISIEVYKLLMEHYGYHTPFYVFAITTFVTTLFILVSLPETKGKTLEEIQLLLKGEKPASICDVSVKEPLTKV